MKAHANEFSELMEQVFDGGGSSFINKGTNGRWRDRLSPEDLRKYEEYASREMAPECAKWIATGQMP